jgi:inosine/guanosine/xanthosine phosphorylase family protein
MIQGRVHLYEGHDLPTVVRVVRALAHLGVQRLVLTNTAGSTRRELPPGRLLLAVECLQFMGTRFGGWPLGLPPRHPARGGAAERSIMATLDAEASARGIALSHGVLAAVLGPNYETAVEVAALRRLGADAVTMSTVPELVAARLDGLAAVVLTVITNWATGVGGRPTHREVTERAELAAGDLARLLSAL